MTALLDPKDVSALLKCSESKVRQMCRDGELQARRIGRCWRISEAVVRKLIDTWGAGENVIPMSRRKP